MNLTLDIRPAEVADLAQTPQARELGLTEESLAEALAKVIPFVEGWDFSGAHYSTLSVTAPLVTDEQGNSLWSYTVIVVGRYRDDKGNLVALAANGDRITIVR